MFRLLIIGGEASVVLCNDKPLSQIETAGEESW